MGLLKFLERDFKPYESTSKRGTYPHMGLETLLEEMSKRSEELISMTYSDMTFIDQHKRKALIVGDWVIMPLVVQKERWTKRCKRKSDMIVFVFEFLMVAILGYRGTLGKRIVGDPTNPVTMPSNTKE